MKSQRFGRYELLEQMGRGGMATILLARLVGPSDFQKHLVIKRIHDHLTTDEETVKRFMDEAMLAARIQHPNVVQLYEFDQLNGTYYIAMEYVHGENLADLYNTVRANTSTGYHWGHAARVVAEAAAGLHAAHELVGGDGQSLRIVHRDVSPQNIMISYDGHVKVADFGIAHAVGRHHNTIDGTVMGKVAYMSPEQCRGEVLDRRTDVFALGIVLYEMVCLRRLFRTKSDQETMRRVLACDFRRPREVRPDLPAGLEQILLRALAARREDRYQTAAELQYAIDGLLAQERALVTASSLAALMGVVFQTKKLEKDRRIQKIYSQTFMQPPRSEPAPAPVAPPPDDALAWDGAAASTVKDQAPPAVEAGERRNKDTMQGFGTPGGRDAVATVDQWDEEAPTTVDARSPEAIHADLSNLPGSTADPMVWPPGALPGSGPTQPTGLEAVDGRDDRPTVDLKPSAAAALQRAVEAAHGPRGDVQPHQTGAVPQIPAGSSEQWPANAHSGVIGETGPAPDPEVTTGKSKQLPRLSDTYPTPGGGSTLRMAIVGMVVAVGLGVGIGVSLTWCGSQGDAPRKTESGAMAAVMNAGRSFTLKVSPASASVTVDDRPVDAPKGGGDRIVPIPDQAKKMTIHAEAEGYVSQTLSVTPEPGRVVQIQLSKPQPPRPQEDIDSATMDRPRPMGARTAPKKTRRRRRRRRSRRRPMRRKRGVGEGTFKPDF